MKEDLFDKSYFDILTKELIKLAYKLTVFREEMLEKIKKRANLIYGEWYAITDFNLIYNSNYAKYINIKVSES